MNTYPARSTRSHSPFRLLGALSLVALGAAFACGDGAKVSGEKDDCVGPHCQNTDPCTTVYKGKCGLPCEAADDCDSGLYCGSDSTCTADCVPHDTSPVCGQTASCTNDGRCRSTLLGAGGDRGGSGGSSSCIDVNVDFDPQIPTVVLLVDQSGSMDGSGWTVPDDYESWGCESNNRWRWNVVRNVLFNPDGGVVTALESQVRFGLTLYSSVDGSLNNGICPMLDKVGIALNNREDMLDRFQCSDIIEDTPTEASLDDAVADLEAFDEPGPKIVILATDGEPDTCECPDFANDPDPMPDECKGDNAAAKQQEAMDGVVSAAAAAQTKDVTVHVINVSNPNNASLQAHLLEVAEAGGGNVYPGFSPNDLREAFETIIGGARSCVFDLEGEIEAGKESDGAVRLNGERLSLGDDDGWRVNSATQVELLGEACESIKTGNPELTIQFPCGSFIIR